MRVLLTTTAHARFGDRLPVGVEPVVMEADGTLSGGTPWEDADVEVAWPTADLFEPDAPLRPFFAFLLQATTIRWIQSPAAGVDAPVFAQLVRRGIRLTTSHVTDIPISEYVLRSVLDHYQRPHEWAASSAERAWRRHDFREVHETTWLVIGVGAIGAAVATRARAFGATVVGVRRTPSGAEPVDRMVSPAEVAGIVGEADVVVLAAPASPETRHLVDGTFLGAMKPRSLLVNIARGALVDEDALVEALDRGTTLEAAVLDVTATEPLPPDSPLWDHPAITITPHDAAGGTGRFARAADLFLENLRRYTAGEPLLHEVTAADLEPVAE
ncbi:MAG TPA: D-2-hydroxyacid dehydrogenase [Acidimicrobiales bacterium]|nr:D-2-hydroxyacid dehydrogenase [Acidimicrobiales bacterium]